MKNNVFIFCILLLPSLTFISGESKAQWKEMSNGLGNNKFISSISISGNNIYISVYNNGIYKSTNNGIEWIQTSLGNLNTICVTASGNNVFTSVYSSCNNSSGIFHSTDYGESWKQTSLDERRIESLAIIGNNVFAGSWACIHPGGVYKSFINGVNWENTLIDFDVESLIVSDNTLYAGTISNPFSAGGLYKSCDKGVTWSLLGLINRSIWSSAVSGDKIYAGTFTGIYITTNNGVNWSQTSLNNQRVRSIVVSGEYVLAGTETGGVFLSRDNGISWVKKNEGLDTLNIKTLLISNDYVFAGTLGKGVYRRSLSEIVNVKQISKIIPTEYTLYQNFPNPFNPNSNIKFNIPQTGHVKLTIFDALGKKITTLVNEILQSGVYQYQFSTDNYQLPSGVYFYNLQSGEFSQTKRMVLLK